MPQKLHILVSTPTFLPIVGGAELGLHEIYKRIGKNCKVTILTPELPDALLKTYASKKDYTTDSYSVVRFKNIFDNVRPVFVKKILELTSLPYIKALRRLNKSEKFDVTNFHYIFPQGMAMAYVKRRLDVPSVLSLVGRSDVWQNYTTLRRLYARNVLQHADAIIPITNYCLEGYEPVGNVNVIPYGVDTSEFSPKRRNASLRKKLGIFDDGFLIFSVQRLSSVKRVDMLIKMMVEVVKVHPEAVLIIGGQGEEYENLKLLIKKLGLDRNVKLIGYISEKALPSYFASADAFTFHSMSETFGIVFAQAMASGLPIVSIKSTCIPEVVLDNENGLLVEPFDIYAFSKAVIRLIEDKHTYNKISTQNRQRAVKEFNWDIIATQYERVLLKVAERGNEYE